MENVNPPDENWKRLDLKGQGYACEPVFVSSEIDECLRTGPAVKIERDTDYEKALKMRITNKSRWTEIYVKMRNIQERDSGCNRFPRFKIKDDATMVFANLENMV